MLDKILVAISMVALIAFLGVVVGFVAEPELIVVTSLMVALALHDFWISVFRPRAHAEAPPPVVPLEALPTGVSGKPARRKKPAANKKAAAKKTSRRKSASRAKK